MHMPLPPLAYSDTQFSVPIDRLRLEQYGDPMRVAFFIAYLIVSRCTMCLWFCLLSKLVPAPQLHLPCC